MRFMMKQLFLLVFLLCNFFLERVDGQNFINGPAISIMDSKAQFANPAIISFQPSHFAFGVKTYHMGFFENSQFDYRHGYFTLSTPRLIGSRFGGGLQAQYFESPIFSRSQFGTSASLQVRRKLAIGVNVSMHYVGYNRDNFVGFDFDDPVFQNGFSRYNLNTAAGIYARPIRNLEVGAGARNLNEPDLSLIGAGANEPIEVFAAVSYNFGLLKGTFEMVNGRYGLQNRTHIEAYSTQGYYVRAGSDMNFDSGYIEAQALLFGGISANYQFKLPFNELAGNTNGSHMISLVFEFNRVPALPDKRKVPEIRQTFERSRTQVKIPPVILLSSDTDHLKYTEININRRVDYNTVTDHDLLSLSVYDLGIIEENPTLEKNPYRLIRPTEEPLPNTIDLTVSLTDRYLDTIELLKDYLIEGRIQELQLLINKGSEIRASGLRNAMRDDDLKPVSISNFILIDEDSLSFRTPVDEAFLQRTDTIILLDPESAIIRPIFTAPINVTNWSLHIYNQENIQINQINGTGSVPEYLEWNWLDRNGDIVDPGLYRYNLRWVTETGEENVSRFRNLYVQKIERNITIDITKDIDQIMDNPDQINIILKNK